MNRIAVIDMGTNTFNLLLAEYSAHSFKVLYSDKQPVKLGQKLKEEHIIDSSGISRIIQTLTYYKNIIEKHQVADIKAIATSSIRTAKNQKEILDTITNSLGLNVEVIDGEREAELIYIANQFSIQNCRQDNSHSPYLIMDIGGGSTEFIIAQQQALWKQSFLLGMARLIDEIQPKDPIAQTDINNVFNYLDNILQPLHNAVKQFQPAILVGSSGVFDSIVEMIEANIRGLSKTESCCCIEKDDFYNIYHQILPLSYAERLNFKGLISMRADMIVMSLLLIDYVLKKYSLQSIIISFYSLKEGVIVEKMKALK